MSISRGTIPHEGGVSHGMVRKVYDEFILLDSRGLMRLLSGETGHSMFESEGSRETPFSIFSIFVSLSLL